MKSSHALTLIAIALACHQGLAVAADVYPSWPVRLIVPYAPGGGSDITARAVGQKLGALALDINPASVDDFRALIESEMRRWKEVVARTNIRLEQ